MKKNINWHRLFGIALMDYFDRTGYEVAVEMDLSVKRQLLDVVVIERKRGAKLKDACAGFDNLGRHNLLTYKSMRESLTIWTLEELVGHYVNYRKIRGLRNVKPEETRLYAVCTRYPSGLKGRADLCQAEEGVFDIRALGLTIRVIALNMIAMENRNAILDLFSGQQEAVRFGAEHYRWKKPDCSTVMNQLYLMYKTEGMRMPYTLEQFKKDVLLDHLDDLKPEDRLRGLKPEDRLRGLRPEDRLRGLRPEDRLRGLRPEDRLRGLGRRELEAHLRKLSRKQNKN
ncbi:MAG: hypothetical protein LC725_07345 [Lentisphaerae bacterium]|nr:hypothetical protein [Lentisphaerota bacterium]